MQLHELKTGDVFRLTLDNKIDGIYKVMDRRFLNLNHVYRRHLWVTRPPQTFAVRLDKQMRDDMIFPQVISITFLPPGKTQIERL